ncbi:U3 snoRNP protein [Cymbomonas tetramitiformis]|uniref:U3 snoRNP protein n=1 Tax=Cymbomonas tetramitiformis TaxID=36881 RepID=A0AAE0G9G0_9CHLO|nr:U3 snoRNP protein [Cymbomonas tetramitiformis]|eukprot:gene2423-3153_t
MDYKFSNLLGAPYRGGNVELSGTMLLSPVGNRVTEVNLTHATSTTLPSQNISTIRTIALSPNGAHLITFDVDGRALLINFHRRVVLHHLTFKSPVVAAKFSPDGIFFAVAMGRLLQVWQTPSLVKEFSPFQLYRTYGGCSDDVTCLDWSDDSRWLCVGSKDLTVRVFSRETVEGFRPPTLSGHRDTVQRVFFAEGGLDHSVPTSTTPTPPLNLYSVSRDGALFHWRLDPESPDFVGEEQRPGGGKAAQGGQVGRGGTRGWQLLEKHFFNQQAKCTCADYHKESQLFVAGFSSGVFVLYQLPGFEMIHTLSISREKISTVSFNESGDWLALGCATLGQLLVWEWRSESYILKQQGHYFDVNTLAYSPDGALLATGADDNKLKVWNVGAGSCFLTFKDHTAPVSAVCFLPAGQAVLSASMDGTVRAYDLARYRNFRTFTTPTPQQLISLAVDHSGEVVVAGTLDSFDIMVWSMRTGRLLDVLSAHEGPVYGLSFSSSQAILASSSWDHTVRIWDVFESKETVECMQHTHDVLTVAYRPDGKQLCSSTLDGQLWFWDAVEGRLQGTVEARRDIAPGRRHGDRVTAANNSSGRCFTSLCYSADGAFLLAGGSSKYVCLYDVSERVLLRRFAMTTSRALDGVLDQLNTKSLTDAGPMELLDTAQSDDDDDSFQAGTSSAAARLKDSLPGTGSGSVPAARTKCVRLAPNGRTWAAATTEGVLVYGLDEETMFDPTDLGEDVTPAKAKAALRDGQYTQALLLALRLNEPSLVRRIMEGVPTAEIMAVTRALPVLYIPRVLSVLAECIEGSAHLGHTLRWGKALAVAHGQTLRAQGRQLSPHLRRIIKGLSAVHADLDSCAGQNIYTLEYLISAPRPSAEGEDEEEEPTDVATEAYAIDEDAEAAANMPGWGASEVDGFGEEDAEWGGDEGDDEMHIEEAEAEDDEVAHSGGGEDLDEEVIEAPTPAKSSAGSAKKRKKVTVEQTKEGSVIEGAGVKDGRPKSARLKLRQESLVGAEDPKTPKTAVKAVKMKSTPRAKSTLAKKKRPAESP